MLIYKNKSQIITNSAPFFGFIARGVIIYTPLAIIYEYLGSLMTRVLA